MNANDYRPGEYGSLTLSPEEEEKEKKKSNKKALIGLAALLVAGGCSSAVCVGSRYIAPQPEPEVAVVVEEREIAPTPTEYTVPISPTPTEAAQEPADVREGWYGYYEGTATGRRTNWKTQYFGEFEDSRFWMQIAGWETCLNEYLNRESFCRDEDTTWGIDISYTYTFDAEAVAEIKLYLPENLSDAPNLIITEDRLVITPTEEQPYELVIERVNGQLEGRLRTTGRLLEQWTEDAQSIPEIDDFVAERTTRDRDPFIVGEPAIWDP